MNVKAMAGKVVVKVKKHAPEILTGVGIIGVVGGGVLACKATLNTKEIIDSHKNTIESVHAYYSDKEDNKKDRQKDVIKVYGCTAGKIVRNYAPALIVEGLSIGCLVSSHKILNKRNLTLAAAYTSLDEGYKRYRSNVVDRYGEEVDREMVFGLKKEKIKMEEVDPETGEVKLVDKKEYVVADNYYSDYSFVFDDGSPYFRKDDTTANYIFIKQAMLELNDKLVAQGHLFFNEVLDAFGYPRRPIGAVAGWLYVPEAYGGNPIGGDNYIRCGLEDDKLKEDNIYAARKRDFINGYEPCIILDFNCDGLIYDKI